MRSEEKYIAYAEKNIVPLIPEANDILRHRFNSEIRLECSKPRIHPPSNYVGVEWMYTHPKGEKAKRIGKIIVTKGWRWEIVFYVSDSWAIIHFPCKSDPYYPHHCRGIVPFAIAAFSYASANVFDICPDFFYIPYGWCFPFYFTDDSITITKTGRIIEFTVSLKFEEACVLLSIEANGLSVKKRVPYGDGNLRGAVKEIARAFEISRV